jgi:hypothetical protein
MAAPFILSIDRHSKDKEAEMEPETFRQWLSERGCTFEAGKDTVRTHGHAHVIVHRGDRSAVLPGVGTKKQLDPRIVRKIVDELGLDWNELPGPASRV